MTPWSPRPVCAPEPGSWRSAAARRNLAPFPAAEVIDGSFETFAPSTDQPFDLVFAATAWHWLDPAVRFERAWQLLSPGGHLAFWSASHVFPEGGDPIFTELNAVYDEIGDGAPLGSVQPPPGELPDEVEQIERSGLFDLVLVRQFAWEIAYDADAYLGLLDTFSAHIAMQPWQRDRLYSEIRCRLEEREDGLLRRGWGAVLHVARRRDGA